MTTASGFSGRFGVFFSVHFEEISRVSFICFYCPKAFCSGVRWDIFHVAPPPPVFPFLSFLSGCWTRGQYGSACKEGTSPRCFVYGSFACMLCCFCCSFLGGWCPGYLAPRVELGETGGLSETTCQYTVGLGPVRGIFRPLGRRIIRWYVAFFLFLWIHLLSQPVPFCLNQVGWWVNDGWPARLQPKTNRVQYIFARFLQKSLWDHFGSGMLGRGRLDPMQN